MRARGGLDDCARDDLLALAEQDCFCGVTLFDPQAKPFPTAGWPSERELFRFQPVVTFPEPGWLEWRDAGTCMIERAPSGAYEEDWRLQPSSRSFARAFAATQRYDDDVSVHRGRPLYSRAQPIFAYHPENAARGAGAQRGL